MAKLHLLVACLALAVAVSGAATSLRGADIDKDSLPFDIEGNADPNGLPFIVDGEFSAASRRLAPHRSRTARHSYIPAADMDLSESTTDLSKPVDIEGSIDPASLPFIIPGEFSKASNKLAPARGELRSQDNTDLDMSENSTPTLQQPLDLEEHMDPNGLPFIVKGEFSKASRHLADAPQYQDVLPDAESGDAADAVDDSESGSDMDLSEAGTEAALMRPVDLEKSLDPLSLPFIVPGEQSAASRHLVDGGFDESMSTPVAIHDRIESDQKDWDPLSAPFAARRNH